MQKEHSTTHSIKMFECFTSDTDFFDKSNLSEAINKQAKNSKSEKECVCILIVHFFRE